MAAAFILETRMLCLKDEDADVEHHNATRMTHGDRISTHRNQAKFGLNKLTSSYFTHSALVVKSVYPLIDM